MLFRLTRPDDWGLALFTIIYLKKKRQKTTATNKENKQTKTKEKKNI